MSKAYKSKAKFTHTRLESPLNFDQKSFRVKKVSPFKEVIVACPKGHYSHGRCKVGTRAQSILTRKR
jgi:hypothetical protein